MVSLQNLGIYVGVYYVNLELEDKIIVYRKWLVNEIQVVVVIVVFGMGIDKLDVRFVIYYLMSKFMENYY